jgi:hypothetical protein
MVKNIQHFRLEGELDPLCNREAFRDGQIVIPVVRTIQPDSLTDCSRRNVRGDVCRICSSSSSVVRQVLRVNEVYGYLSWDAVDANGALQL